jgi:hypothetical protein
MRVAESEAKDVMDQKPEAGTERIILPCSVLRILKLDVESGIFDLFQVRTLVSYSGRAVRLTSGFRL